MAVSVDISMANLARPGVNAVFHDNNLRFVHSDGEFSLIWSAIHDVYVRESGQNLVLDTISQPTFFQILGGGIVSHRMDFVDTFCLNQSSSCEQEGRDFAGVLEIVDKDREVNIEIDLDFLNVATKNINCRINFSDLDMLLLVVNDWVAKKCKF
ncbi:MAG: hypothetical protein P1U37_15800 [Minwuia sp.]|nr:hypothetical protein [Minwuia sp.]